MYTACSTRRTEAEEVQERWRVSVRQHSNDRHVRGHAAVHRIPRRPRGDGTAAILFVSMHSISNWQSQDGGRSGTRSERRAQCGSPSDHDLLVAHGMHEDPPDTYQRRKHGRFFARFNDGPPFVVCHLADNGTQAFDRIHFRLRGRIRHHH